YVGLLARELERPTARTTLMPGVEPLLQRLERAPRGLLGLLTGNPARGAAPKLRSAGIDPGRFRLGAFGSDAAHRPDLPAIAARRAERWFGRVPSGPGGATIGATPADIQCGPGISARAVAVATGGYSVPELAACGPHAVFEDLSASEVVRE